MLSISDVRFECNVMINDINGSKTLINNVKNKRERLINNGKSDYVIDQNINHAEILLKELESDFNIYLNDFINKQLGLLKNQELLSKLRHLESMQENIKQSKNFSESLFYDNSNEPLLMELDSELALELNKYFDLHISKINCYKDKKV
jgi:hypothetical protein